MALMANNNFRQVAVNIFTDIDDFHDAATETKQYHFYYHNIYTIT